MGGVVEALLAAIGLIALVVAGFAAGAVWLATQVENPDAGSDPYREGLDAAGRISAMAFEAERTMHQVAHNNRDLDEE